MKLMRNATGNLIVDALQRAGKLVVGPLMDGFVNENADLEGKEAKGKMDWGGS